MRVNLVCLERHPGRERVTKLINEATVVLLEELSVVLGQAPEEPGLFRRKLFLDLGK